jgi:hypothetical protein
LTDLGFAFNTQVSVRDIFARADVGLFTSTFTTKAPIPLHGVLWLRVAYSAQYSTVGVAEKVEL